MGDGAAEREELEDRTEEVELFEVEEELEVVETNAATLYLLGAWVEWWGGVGALAEGWTPFVKREDDDIEAAEGEEEVVEGGVEL